MTHSPSINLVFGPSFPGLTSKSLVFVFVYVLLSLSFTNSPPINLAHPPSWSVIQKFWCKEKAFPWQGNSQWCLILRKLVTETHPKFYFSPLSGPFRKWGISANLVPSLTIRKANFPEWWLGVEIGVHKSPHAQHWQQILKNTFLKNTWTKMHKGEMK